MPTRRSAEKPSFEEFLANSENFQRILSDGLPLITRLDRPRLQALADLSLASFDDPHAGEQPGVPEKLGLSNEETESVVLAGAVLAMSADAREPTAEISRILRKRFSLADPDNETILSLLEEFRRKADVISKAIEKNGLAREILPSFEHARSTVDIRVKLSAGKVPVSAAVAIVMIRTDARAPNNRFWFQMSKSQLRRLIGEMQETLTELEKAEKWAERQSANP